MAELEVSCEDVLCEEFGGNHLVLWYRTDDGRAQAVLRFLRQGIDTDDMLAIILPLQELQHTEDVLIEARFPVERLMSEGRLLLFASEEVAPRDIHNCSEIIEAVSALRERAAAQGRELRLVGRVAPMLFERGDIEGAMAVEQAADSSLGQARLLCLYDIRSREKLPEADGQRIDHLHNHVMCENRKGKVKLQVKSHTRTAKKARKR